MKISKIKYNHGGDTAEIIFETGDSLATRKVDYNGYMSPGQRFVDLIYKLGEQVLVICDLPKDYFEPLKNPEQPKLLPESGVPSGLVTGVTFSYSAKGNMSASICAEKKVNITHNVLVINTPVLPFETHKGSPELPPVCRQLLDELIEEARAYAARIEKESEKQLHQQLAETLDKATSQELVDKISSIAGAEVSISTGRKTVTSSKGASKEVKKREAASA